MGDPFRKVQAGQPLTIPAEAFNAFLDAAQDLRNRRQSRQQEPFPQFRQSGIVRLKNGSGVDQERFAALGIDRPIILPADNLPAFQNEVTLVGVIPDEDLHRSRFAILLEPLREGAIGRACVSGVCPVRLKIHSNDHRFAEIRDGQSITLQSDTSGGAAILWVEESGGDPEAPRWAVVRIDAGGGGGHETVLFRITDVAYDCAFVVATVLAESCGFRAPDTIRVYDVAGCHFNVPPDDLLGIQGFAQKFQWHQAENAENQEPPPYPFDDPYADRCVWVVLSLCCTGEVGEDD